MTMKRFAAVLGTASLLAFAAFAAPAGAADHTGEVTSVDPAAGQLMIETDAGEPMTFEIEPEVRVERSDGETVPVQQLQPGARVRVDVTEGGEIRKVDRIQILEPRGDAMADDASSDTR